MEHITEQDKLNFKAMMSDSMSSYQDNTEHIRNVKHSVNIRDDIRKFNTFKKMHDEVKKSDPKKYYDMCSEECCFLFNNYHDIFNRLVKEELDLDVMTQLLTVLKMIEDGKIDQNDGSIMVGKTLKKLYLDSALKRADNLDREHQSEKSSQPQNETKNISWKEYTKLNKKND